jgi:hypothetical protein
MIKLYVIFFIVLIILPSHFTMAQTDEEAVISTVQQFFDAMTARDTIATLEVLLPEGQYFSIGEDNSGIAVKRTTHAEYLIRLAASKESWVEKMQEPEVLIQGRVAILWAQYRFYRKGQFSHCGVDAFSLLKTATGWKIAGLVFSKEIEGCDK